MFSILKKDSGSKARTGILHTAHGDVKTPVFLPIGTKGAVKAIASEELRFWGAEMILANTYHLWMRPGDALVAKAGGLHSFMNWKGAILTDSGGFQVFSLSKMVKVSEAGVKFQSDIDGTTYILTPESSVQIQLNLGSDIALVLDEFPGFPATKKQAELSVKRTTAWAKRALAEHRRLFRNAEFNSASHVARSFMSSNLEPINRHATNTDPESSSGLRTQQLWGIVQGSTFKDLRKQSVEEIQALGFPGLCVGGVAVGEPSEVMYEAVLNTLTYCSEELPKHLLGVGTPEQIVKAVSLGIDSFDCVIPTREARHGKFYVNLKPQDGAGYYTLNIDNNVFKEDFTPIDDACPCFGCMNYTKAYIRHLFLSREPLGIRLATMHNLRFYLDLMDNIRNAIESGSFKKLSAYKEIKHD